MAWEDEIEHRWEIRHAFAMHTAKHVQEIDPPDEPDRDLSDTMAPIEELTSTLGVTMPWTCSAFTAWGLERKMRRIERKGNFVGKRVVVYR